MAAHLANIRNERVFCSEVFGNYYVVRESPPVTFVCNYDLSLRYLDVRMSEDHEGLTRTYRRKQVFVDDIQRVIHLLHIRQKKVHKVV